MKTAAKRALKQYNSQRRRSQGMLHLSVNKTLISRLVIGEDVILCGVCNVNNSKNSEIMSNSLIISADLKKTRLKINQLTHFFDRDLTRIFSACIHLNKIESRTWSVMIRLKDNSKE